jgi:hypothetical protein
VAGPSCIRTPLAQRWQRFRQRVLPIVCFGAGVLFTLLLWERQVEFPVQPRAGAATRPADTSDAEELLVSRPPAPPGTRGNPPQPALDPAQPGPAATGNAAVTPASDHGSFAGPPAGDQAIGSRSTR